MWLLGYEYAQNHCPGEKKEKEKLLFSIYLHMKQFQEHIPSYTTKMH
jgi:hypothetical protein